MDSYAVLAEHYFAPVLVDLRLTHLTFFNVGSHNSGEKGRRLFHDRYDLLAPEPRSVLALARRGAVLAKRKAHTLKRPIRTRFGSQP